MSRVHGIAPHEITFIFREFHELHNPERDRRKGLGLGLSIVQRLTKTLQYELSVHSIFGKGSRFSIALPLSTVPAQAAEGGVRAEPHTVQPLHWRVMVVDDDEFVRTGIEVIAALRTTHPNLPAILVTGESAPDHLAEAQNGGAPLLHEPVRPDNLYNVIVRVSSELALDGLPLARTNAEGGALRYEYDGARRLKALINENQARYDFAYDALNRLIEETGFDARNTRYHCDPTGLLLAKLEAGTLTGQERLARTQPAADSTSPIIPPQRTAPTLDDPWGLGMLDDTAPPQAPPGHAITTRYERDAGGRLVRKQVAGNVLQADGTLSSQHKSITYRYDPAGRLTEATNAQGAKTTLSYDAIGQLVSEARTGQGLHSQLLHQYDALGNRTQTTLPDGRTLNWLYYGSGHLHQINLDGEVISDIERDALHRETFRTQGALQSRYQYDALGRLSAQATWRTALRNTSSMTSTPTERPGAWAALGDEMHMNSARPAQGAAILGRRYQYDLAGNLQGINDLHHGTTQYQYDKIGRLLSAMQPRLNERFAFDPAHNMVPPDGSSKERTPGLIKNNRLEVFEDKRFTYDTHGNLIEKRIGKHTIIQLSWDVEHQLQCAKVIKAAHTSQPVTTDTSYRYDAFGRRLEKKGIFGNTLFEWDSNRLLAERKGSQQTLYMYEPDSFAPLAQVCSAGVVALGDETVRQTASSQVIHLPEEDDEEDWQPRKSRQTFEDHMRAMQQATLERVREQGSDAANDERVGNSVSTEADHGTNLVRIKDWSVRYYHNDHLGTPRELSSERGEMLWSATYKAWGNTLRVELERADVQIGGLTVDPSMSEEIEQNLRFQGQYFDEETGLHYNRFRYYDPDVGRFVSQDPIGLLGVDNLYLYAPNTTGWTDVLGLVCKVQGIHEDNASKGVHINASNGVELMVRPGQNGSIIFKPVFSSSAASKVDEAIKEAQKDLTNPEWRKKLLDTTRNTKKYMTGLSKCSGPLARMAQGKAAEAHFLEKALEKMIAPK
ncbi:RHS repeat-associated core domain-containing protein [Diaphorobacter sp.]|uniref:RHS repeat-associated core domain-containing protein n=1 Tax=Diaphorobacter sp. TaxID=1934310 RepID=UPI0028AA4B53|nr:RHS repeat-associated core domain-containing protein [Diaphorobacter sp.]